MRSAGARHGQRPKLSSPNSPIPSGENTESTYTTDTEAHAVLGDVDTMLDFDWTTAERHFSRARELNPTTQVRCRGSEELAPGRKNRRARQLCQASQRALERR